MERAIIPKHRKGETYFCSGALNICWRTVPWTHFAATLYIYRGSQATNRIGNLHANTEREDAPAQETYKRSLKTRRIKTCECADPQKCSDVRV